MTRRLTLLSRIADGRLAELQALFPGVAMAIGDMVTFTEPLDATLAGRLVDLLAHPLRHIVLADGAPLPSLPPFRTALEVGFLPGVTDNGATTARALLDALDAPAAIGVHTGQLYLIDSDDPSILDGIRRAVANPLIQRTALASRARFLFDGGMAVVIPRVRARTQPPLMVPLRAADGERLAAIGKRGVPEPRETGAAAGAGEHHRGPLGLDLASMRAIRDHFAGLGRDPTDVELECLAQTWSEHCKHTLFAAPIDEVEEGLFRGFIKRATAEVRAARGAGDICLSVFSDNAGGIIFDDDWMLCDKVETHNTPSALDPFGGAITGVLGVNRDVLGFGLGAKPILNRYGFCLPPPGDDRRLWRDADRRQELPQGAALTRGVIRGIEQGGNHAGIPSPRGVVWFHPRYRGKPLVFAGTVGIIPRSIAGKPSHEKGARPGDLIVVAGGRVGKDGIHGATFSSEALDEGSPSTAVQIGDPITQKRVMDAILRDLRETSPYTALTDNGAGGLSSSVGEMARDAGGFTVALERVPLKYPGLSAWEIWISESQERMTLAVPPPNVDAVIAAFARHGAEATVIGSFNDSGRAVVTHHGETVMDLAMAFLHEGNPVPQLVTRPPAPIPADPAPPAEAAPGLALPQLLAHPNGRSRGAIARRYDHEVQGASALKPLQGPGEVFADAAAICPVPDSPRAAVVTEALAPEMSELDARRMAHWTIATAALRAVAAGADPAHLAIQDNFCWCSPHEPERLHQLKQAALGCYEAAVALGLPFISGKDSMHNDFRGFDAAGPVAIAVPPTLLISALGVARDWRQLVSLDLKAPGDRLLVAGVADPAMGGSLWHALHGCDGHAPPATDLPASRATLEALHRAITGGLVRAAVAIGHGGLAVAAARMAIAGGLGAALVVPPPEGGAGWDSALYGEGAGRALIAVAPDDMPALRAAMAGTPLLDVGVVTAAATLSLRCGDVTTHHGLTTLAAAYRTPLDAVP